MHEGSRAVYGRESQSQDADAWVRQVKTQFRSKVQCGNRNFLKLDPVGIIVCNRAGKPSMELSILSMVLSIGVRFLTRRMTFGANRGDPFASIRPGRV